LLRKKKDRGPCDLAAAMEQCRRDVLAMKEKDSNCFRVMASRCGPVLGLTPEKKSDDGKPYGTLVPQGVTLCSCGMANNLLKVVCSRCFEVLTVDIQVNLKMSNSQAVSGDEPVQREICVGSGVESFRHVDKFLQRVTTHMVHGVRHKESQKVWVEKKLKVRAEAPIEIPPFEMIAVCVYKCCGAKVQVEGPVGGCPYCKECTSCKRLCKQEMFSVKQWKVTLKKCSACVTFQSKLKPVGQLVEVGDGLLDKLTLIGQLVVVDEIVVGNNLDLRRAKVEHLITWNESCLLRQKDGRLLLGDEDSVGRVNVKKECVLDEQKKKQHPAEKYIIPSRRKDDVGQKKQNDMVDRMITDAIRNFEYDKDKKTQYEAYDDDVQEVDIIVESGDEYGLHSPDWHNYGDEEVIPSYVVSVSDEMYSAMVGQEVDVPVSRPKGNKKVRGKLARKKIVEDVGRWEEFGGYDDQMIENIPSVHYG